MNGHFTVVVWHDAHATLDEQNADEIKAAHKPSLVHTHGYVIVSDDGGISIAGEWLPAEAGGDETFRNVTFVPRGMIVDIQEIKKPIKRKKKGAAVEKTVALISTVGEEKGSGEQAP